VAQPPLTTPHKVSRGRRRVKLIKRIYVLGILALTLTIAVPPAQAGPTTYVTNDCVHVVIEPLRIMSPAGMGTSTRPAFIGAPGI